MTIEDHTDKVVLTVLVTDSSLVNEARNVVLEVIESTEVIWWIELEIYIKQNQVLAFVSDLLPQLIEEDRSGAILDTFALPEISDRAALKSISVVPDFVSCSEVTPSIDTKDLLFKA